MKKLAVSILAIVAASAAMAQIADGAVALPMESGGLLALTVACLAVGIRIVQRKRNR
ncbi:hypothetical protein [Rhodoferax sp. UBA5149]|uniref:hypothetical protein n=1 Tax=Rhodoferax sp. UBA5149 TaxID=1947379 RepID=UPI0025E99FD7|nr:hypothetical protein [Rhodoferax sp. UBA5149]